MPAERYDLVVIGGGPGGLVGAEHACDLGLKVALVERAQLGGCSLATGSIPSKTFLATARLCARMREGADLAVAPVDAPQVHFSALKARIVRVQARIAERHSLTRLEARGVDVFFGEARFADHQTVTVGDATLAFRKALVATGARPRGPDCAGLAALGYRDSDSIFDLDDLPKRLAVIGGGPLGCEMAQAFQRLGSRVVIVQDEPKFLPREDREASDLLAAVMRREGVDIRLNTRVIGAHLAGRDKVIEVQNYENHYDIPADEVLLSVGRAPNLEGLDLDKAGVLHDETGIGIDAFLKTSNPSIYAAGDVCTAYRFTNVAAVSAKVAVDNAFQGAGVSIETLVVPWATFCDPEIAHVGLQAWQARSRGVPIKTYTVMMSEVDRAVTDGCDDGFVKLHVEEGTDRILGATIAADRASEMITAASFAISQGIGLRALSRTIHAYPSQSAAVWVAAAAFLKDDPEPDRKPRRKRKTA